jgi:hypothetical protein
MENEEGEEPIGQLLHGESVTPLCGSWRMENGEWLCGETFAQEVFSFSILHPWRRRSFLHSPISENGPSTIQGERATSPFSIL